MSGNVLSLLCKIRSVTNHLIESMDVKKQKTKRPSKRMIIYIIVKNHGVSKSKSNSYAAACRQL